MRSCERVAYTYKHVKPQAISPKWLNGERVPREKIAEIVARIGSAESDVNIQFS